MIELNNQLTASFEGLDQLLLVYNELDEMIYNYKKASNITCITKCSECCNKPNENIEVTILEMIPLSIYLWQKGEAEEIITQLNNTESTASCIMYRKEVTPSMEGGCSIYQWRPLICRLFGFSAIQDKKGKMVPSLCRYIKASQPFLEGEIVNKINAGLTIPINADYSHKVALINPSLGQKRYPINIGLKQALEMVGFRMALLGLIDYNNNDDDNHDNTPPKPRGRNFNRSA